MKVYIKNMVCNRCIMAVENVFKQSGHTPEKVELGEVELNEHIPDAEMKPIGEDLQKLGFEVIDDAKSRIIERIKNIIIRQVHHSEGNMKVNYSTLIESELHKDYNYLSSLFSAITGITIEKYIIDQKIERVKELLVYNELTLSEIAFNMGYSSVAHLSNQFKKVTGLTPSHFKEIGITKRKPLDEVM